MPREKETSRKRHAKGKRMKERRQEKDDKTSRERDFKGKACREKRMSGKNRTCAERIRDLKKSAKGKRDVKKKLPRLQEKEILRKRHAERNGCQERDMPRE